MNGNLVRLVLLVFASILITLNSTRGYSAPPVSVPVPESRQAQADQLFQQGIEQYRANQTEAAIHSWQQALELYQQLQDRQKEGATLGNLGAAYLALGNYHKAIEFLEGFLAITRSTNHPLGEAQALSNLGIAYQGLKNYNKALELFQESLVKARAIRNPQAEGIALTSLAMVYADQENYAEAIKYYTQSLTLIRSINDKQTEGRVLGDLGIAYKNLGDYQKSIESHQQALEIVRELKDRDSEGKILVNLGNAYEGLGNYEKAIQLYQESLSLTREINDRIGEGTALGNLGAIYANQGQYDQAIESYQQSLSSAQTIGDKKGEANTFNNLGIAYQVKGNLNQAIDYYTKSLTIARAIGDRQLEAKTLGGLGLAYEDQQNFTKAIEHQQQTLKIAQEIGDRRLEALAFNNLGHALKSAGKLPEAEKNLREAIKILESLRPGLPDTDKISIFDTQVLTYNLLQQIIIEQNKPEAALEIAEQGRARAFVELLAQRLSPQVALDYKANMEPPTIEQIKQIARLQKATLVEYSIVPQEEFKVQGKQRGKASELLIWVVQPMGKVEFRRIDLKSLDSGKKGNATSFESLVRSSRILQGPRVDQGDAARKKLYQLLIEPIADFLPKNPEERVIFIPQESLFLLAFPALQDASGQYLIEKHTIMTAPAIQVLALTHQKRQTQRAQYTQPLQGKDILVVGNPTMPFLKDEEGKKPKQLAPLPSSEEEALAIANLLQTQAIIGDRATKRDIVQQLPKARLIHLATHGLLDDIREFGVPGAIALAPSPNDDGFLTSGEVFNLKLNAELVVLSACHTGQGNITGDGVVGLSRAWISAGVPSAIVSLWAVPDVPTSVLMKEFYRHLQGQPDKAQALRQAMLATMKQYPAPYNWAAFTLIGEAE
jgi:CHAT domain-containing protein/lipopolysaccharide biosynthesis regulator YciM